MIASLISVRMAAWASGIPFSEKTMELPIRTMLLLPFMAIGWSSFCFFLLLSRQGYE